MAGTKTRTTSHDKPRVPAKAAVAPKPAAQAKTPAPAKKATLAKLPAALAERAEQQIKAKQARLAKEARADIALVKRRQTRITEDFYDIGEALVRLKQPGVAEAIGRSTFRELCETDLGMSLSTADRLIAIVTQIPRDEAQRMGQQRALALLDLARATPEADTPAQLETSTRTLPSGKKLAPGQATTREILAAAKELRETKPATGKPRGRTTSAEERALAAELQASLRKAGFDHARVSAVATKPGQGADVRIERVPLADLRALGRAISKGA